MPFLQRANLLVVMLCISGCVTRGNVELLESQLRQQEDQLFAMRAQLDDAKVNLELAEKELQTLRKQMVSEGELALLPEQAKSLYRVEGIRVNKFFSGGLDRDGEPGDDLLNVVIAPHDRHGETVKLPGDLEIEAIDVSAPASSRRLGVWRYSADEVAEHWQSGLTSGFQFRMPWQTPPTSPDILLQARFSTADGRQFGTSEQVRVALPDADVDIRNFANAGETLPAEFPVAAPPPTSDKRQEPNTEDPLPTTAPDPQFELRPSNKRERKPLLNDDALVDEATSDYSARQAVKPNVERKAAFEAADEKVSAESDFSPPEMMWRSLDSSPSVPAEATDQNAPSRYQRGESAPAFD